MNTTVVAKYISHPMENCMNVISRDTLCKTNSPPYT